MNASLLKLTSILVVITAAVAAAKTPLREAELEISAILFILLFILKVTGIGGNRSRFLTACLFSFVTAFIVLSTGATASPFFFLMYFLLFTLSLLLEPFISIIVTVYLMVVLTSLLEVNQTIREVLPIVSLGMISPFALYLGAEYEAQKKEHAKREEVERSTIAFLNQTLGKHIEKIDTLTESISQLSVKSDIKNQLKIIKSLIRRYDNTMEADLES